MLSYQSPMPAGAGTPRYEKPELWLGTTNWHGGFCDAPPRPSGGQAPALHFLIPPSTIGLQFGTFRPLRAGIEVDWRAHPGSESGTCFRTNNEGRGADYEEYPPADHHAVERQGIGQRSGACPLGFVGPAATQRSSCQAISQKASSQRLLVTKASRMRSRPAGPTPSASRSIRSRHHSTSVTNSLLA